MRKHYPLNPAGAEDAGRLPWTDGVPNTGTEGSYPGHALMTDSEAEILAAQSAAGLTQNGSDLTQLAQAISRGTWLGAFGGSANALVAAVPNDIAWPALLPGMRFTGTVAQTNTGSVTIALSGFATPPGSLSLLRRDGQPLQAGDLKVGLPFSFIHDGSAFRVATPAASELPASASLIHRGTNVGTANDLVASLAPAIAAYDQGAVYVIKLSAPNTGPVTANLDQRGALPVVRSNGTALRAGDISIMAVLTYDGVANKLVLANLAQEIAPPGSGFGGQQSHRSFTPPPGQASTLSASFTTAYAGVVIAIGSLNTTSQNQNIITQASISINGTVVNGNADAISGACVSTVFASVPAGATIQVKCDVTPSQSLTFEVSQYLTYAFIPS